MSRFPCGKCKRMFMSAKGLANHKCGEVKQDKPPKVDHKRGKPKRGDHTRITDKVRKEVERRSGGACERCGVTQAICFQMAHLINASQMGSGREPWNIAKLCGTHGESGTCHHWADNTIVGREWRLNKRKRLIEYYTTGEGREHWSE